MLLEMQSAWRVALLRPTGSPIKGLTSGLDNPRFMIHRSNVLTSLSDALVDAFPTVYRVLGRSRFLPIAIEFVTEMPLAIPQLLRYGADFADFLERYSIAETFPWLGDLARLDWACIVAFHAPDENTIVPAAFDFDAAQAGILLLRPHSSVSLVSSAYPIFDIRLAIQRHGSVGTDPVPGTFAVLVMRRAMQVVYEDLGAGRPGRPGRRCFLEEIMNRKTLLAAAESAVAVDPSFDLQEELVWHFQMGIYSGWVLAEEEQGV